MESAKSDATLWRQAAIGKSNDACSALVDRHRATIWGVCSQLLLCRDDMEEAFQVTILALLENGDDIKSPDFTPWLYRVAYRAALRVRADSCRKTPQAISLPERSAPEEAFRKIEEVERCQMVAAAIDDLSKRHREVLVLHYVRGLSREEVARQLGMTLPAVKGRLSKARSLLRSRLVRNGISLAAVTAFLMKQSDAAEMQATAVNTIEALKPWLAGRPVSLAKIHYSDLNGRDAGMATQRVFASKYMIGTACTAVVLAAFFGGQLIRGSAAIASDSDAEPNLILASYSPNQSDVAPLPTMPVYFASQSTESVAEPVPAKVDSDETSEQPTNPSRTPVARVQVAEPPLLQAQNSQQPAMTNPALTNAAIAHPVQPAVSQSPIANSPYRTSRSHTTDQPATPIHRRVSDQPFTAPLQSSPSWSADMAQVKPKQGQRAPVRGLPSGTWVRETPFGKVTSVVNGNQIRLTVASAESLGVEWHARAEFAVASDGTIYGLVHGVEADLKQTTEMSIAEAAEHVLTMNAVTDLPFTLRCHSDENTVTIKSFNVGAPLNPALAEAFDPQEMLLFLTGTFHSQPVAPNQRDYRR